MGIDRVRRHIPALGLILGSALVVRVLWVALVHPDPAADGRFDDTVWYYYAAKYFANGDGYVNPFSGTPTAGWPPGYPVFLGTVFAWFGAGIWQAYAANIALAMATAGTVYALGLRLFDQRTALVAAMAIAVWPGQVYFSSLSLSEPLFTLLFLLAVLLIVLAPSAGTLQGLTIMGFGCVLGLAVLTRGQAAILLPIAVVWWIIAGLQWRPAMAWGVLAACIVVVMLAPWVARNEQKLGSPVIIATNLGANLWIGHHDGASGRMAIDAPIPLPNREGLTQPEYEVAGNDLALRKGLRYMLTHPGHEVTLSITKIRAMYESDATALDWNSGYTRNYYASADVERFLRGLANGFWFAALALSAVGLLAARDRLRGPMLLLPLLVVAWTLTHLLFFGDSRFHYPIVFVFALMGARGLVAVYDALRRPLPHLAAGYAEA